MELVNALAITGAARWTDYSTSGTVWTWKLGGSYEPIPDVRFRVTRSRDIRAPTLFELFAGRTQGAIGGQLDPHTGVLPSNVVQYGGGNAALVPEVGNTLTVGVVLEPAELVPGLT